jgi:hypothetical protein
VTVGIPFARNTLGQIPVQDLINYYDRSVFRRIRACLQEIYAEIDQMRGVQGGNAEYSTLASLPANSGTYIPVFTSLTTTGSPTYTGSWWQAGKIRRVQILITAAGGTTKSVQGTTTVTLPFSSSSISYGDVRVYDLSTRYALGQIQGIDNNSSKIYLPNWMINGHNLAIRAELEV